MNKSRIQALTLIAMLAAAAAILSAPDAKAVPVWAESFGLDGHGPDPQGFYGTGDDFPLGIAAMPDGGVVVVGKLSYPTDSSAGTYALNNDALIRFGSDGTILWKKALSGTDGLLSDSGYRFARIVSDSQGNIYLASIFSAYAGSGGPSYTYAAKFAPDGTVVWQSNLGGSGSQTISDIVTSQFNSLSLAPNGNLVLTCSAAPATGGLSFPALFVVDAATGGVVFRRAYHNTSAQYLPAQAGCGSRDGTKYLFCTPYNDLSVLVTNAAGDILDIKNYFTSYQRSGATMSIPTADGDFMVLSGNVIRKIGVDQVTVNGVTTTTLVTRFERVINYAGMGGHTIVQTADGGYLIGGSIMVGGGDLPPNTSGSKAGVYKLNAQGDVTRVFAYGGFSSETAYDANTSPGLCSAVPTTDGGFAFATDTLSYRNQPSFDERKPDWWVVKTDALGGIRNFRDVMVDLTARGSSVPFTDADPQSLGTYEMQAITPRGGTVQLVLSEPEANLRIQASPPRISSSRTAEAVVSQHFAYHIRTSFFDVGATISYSATGLPTGFVFNGTTGVISGVAAPGSETTTPILVTLNATDGTAATFPFILSLTIGDGIPGFTVNGSDQPSAIVTDSVLRFAVTYPGTLAGRFFNVQATTTPNNEASWQKLANGTNGYMTYDLAISRYILNSTSYPASNGIYFRAQRTARGYADLPSNVVGPFNLASNATRAPQTLFSIKRDGLRADFDFRAILISPPSGTAVRVQRSITPADESSWADLQDPTSGQMIQEGTDPTRRALVFNTYLPADAIYFRSVTTASGSINTLSNLIGPYRILADVPPLVTITPPPGNGTGQDFDHPIVIPVDANGVVTFTISASATSNRLIRSLRLLFDGSTINTVTGGATTVSQAYTTTRVGDHVVEAVAMDDLGASGRAGTKPLYIRVIPAGSGAARGTDSTISGEATTSSLGGKVFTAVNGGGYWRNPTTWRDAQGNNGVPRINDFAIVGAARVVFEDDGTGLDVGSVSISGGQLYGNSFLAVNGTITIAGGSFDNGMSLIIRRGATLELLNSSNFTFRAGSDGVFGTLLNSGTINVHGSGNLLGVSDFSNHGILNWQAPLLVPNLLGYNLSPEGRAIVARQFESDGLIRANGLIATGGGNVVSNDSAGLISQDGGTLITNDGGTLITNDGGTLITNDGGTLITNDGGTLVGNSGGTIRSPGGFPGAVSTEAATVSTGFTQTGGQTDLSSIAIVGPVTINGGVLSGTGLINGVLSFNGGYISPGLIAVTGNYIQGSGATLIVEAAGGEANQSGRLQVGGTATLGGAVKVRTIGGYVPLPNDPFVPVGASSLSGAFSSSSANVQLTTTPTGVIAVLNPAAPNPTPAALVNIATRMRVESGDNVLIGGFIVTGSVPKRVIIRAIGPSLPVAGALADPILELHAAGGSVTTNDDWRATQEAEIIATTVPPSSNLESAIVATLSPGAHTAIVRGKNGGTGVGLVEVYDLETATASKIVNISTRGRVQTGDDVMIGGIIIQGTEPAKVLIRAIGPSLPVGGALADPMLELHDRNGNVIQNDDWRETQETEIIATTVPPTSNAEAALVVTLVPDAYTAVVRGKNGTTGVALVEAYTLQN